MKKNDIAIIGMAVNLPGISNLKDLWRLMENKETLVRDFPKSRANDLKRYIEYLKKIGIQEPETKDTDFYDGCFFENIKQFDYNFFGFSPKVASVADPQQRLLLKTVYMALEDSGYINDKIENTKTGVFVGFAANPGNMYSDYLYKVDYGLSQVSLTGVIPSMFANRLSYIFNLHGPSSVLDCACSSSLVAVHNAKNSILTGECDMAIVAGSRLVYSPVKSQAASIGIESTDGYTRTFDKSANGTGYGEGSGAIVLKRLDQAEKDGDNIYAIIRGSAINHDGHKDSITTPNSISQCHLLHDAWKNAEIDPRNIKYIEAHGTATRIGDPIEVEGLRQAFADYKDFKCAVGTVKTNIGHLYEGSGVMAIIKAALVAKKGIIPPIANYKEENPVLNLENSPVIIPTESIKIQDETYNIGISAFGLGGTNCHIILENYREKEAKPVEIENGYFTISAKTETAMSALIKKYLAFIPENASVKLSDLCFTTNFSRAAYDVKLGIKVSSVKELENCLTSIIEKNSLPENVVYTANLKAIDNSKNPCGDEILDTWINSGNIDLSKLAYASNAKKIILPTYAFEETDCWVAFPDDYQINCMKDTYSLSNSSLTHEIEFVPCEYFDKEINTADTLIIKDKDYNLPLPSDKVKDFVIHNIDVKSALIDEACQISEVNKIMDIIDDKNIKNIIYTLPQETEAASSYEDFSFRVRKNLYTLFLLTKEIILNGSKINFAIISHNAIKIHDTDVVAVPENSTIAGYMKVIQREYPFLQTKMIDLSGAYNADLLFVELFSDRQGVFCIRNNTLYKEQFREFSFDKAELDSKDYIKENGVYLITGGTGGIGLEVCKHFASMNSKISLVLLNRTKLPEPETWESVIKESTDKKVISRLTDLLNLKKQGVNVRSYSCDISNASQVKEVLALINKEVGTINGVVHAAGVPGKSIIQTKSLQEFDSVVRPKVFGSYILESVIPPESVDFYLYFSSVATTFPSAGQSDYAAGNYYLDTISQNQKDKNIKKVTCDWVAWKEVGMAVDYNTNMDTTFKAITNEEGISVIDNALRSRKARVFGGRINYDSDVIQILPDFQISLSDGIKEKITATLRKFKDQSTQKYLEHKKFIDSIDVDVSNGNADDKDLLLVVAKCWSNCLGFSEYDADVDFLDYGGDSISALSIVSDLSSYIGKEISLASFMSNSTINKLTNFIMRENKKIGA